MTGEWSSDVGNRPVDPGLVTYTHVIYGLHALSAAIGILGAASIVGSFVFGVPSIIAVIMNYARRSEVRGTWLDSHFSWQIRTFWWALAIAVVVGLIGLVLLPALGFGLVVWWIGFFVLGIWAIYRIARGWLRLKDRQPMPAA